MIGQESGPSGVSRRSLLFGAPSGHMPSRLKRPARIGSNCLSLQGVACRACEDACAGHAIRFRPRPGGHFHPVVETDLCHTCGDCLSVCPVAAISLSQGPDHG